MAGKEGIAYILTNESMPGFVKIDFTETEDIARRICELNKTSNPLPFEIYFAARVPDVKRLEQTLPFVFSESRIGRNGDFFKIDPKLPKSIIELVAHTLIELTDEEQGIEENERQEINRLRLNRNESPNTFKSAQDKEYRLDEEFKEDFSPFVLIKTKK